MDSFCVFSSSFSFCFVLGGFILHSLSIFLIFSFCLGLCTWIFWASEDDALHYISQTTPVFSCLDGFIKPLCRYAGLEDT